MRTSTTSLRPSHLPPKTLKQAKNDFKVNGPRISTQQSRQLARGVELYERAEKIKDAEKRKRQNAVRKAAKEERERESRKRMGIPSPPRRDVKRVAASQKLLIGFVRVVGVAGKEEKVAETEGKVCKEGAAQDAKVLEEDREQVDNEEDYLDDTLDDTSLLEAVAEECLKGSMPDRTAEEPQIPRPSKRRRLQKSTSIQATTSFSSNDFVLAREITWTQDIEAAKSRSVTVDVVEEIITPTVQDATPVVHPPTSRSDLVWADFLLSNTQLEREIAPSPPVIRTRHTKDAEEIAATTQPILGPTSSDSFSTLPDSPTLEMQMTSLSRNTVDDTFLSMLSTQDLSFSFSSPEMPPNTHITNAHNAARRAADVLSSFCSPPEPSPQLQAQQQQQRDAEVMPSPPLPRASTVQLKTSVSPTSMPPPPLPRRLSSTTILSPTLSTTIAIDPVSPQRHLIRPLQRSSLATQARTKAAQSTHALFLKPSLPITSHNRDRSNGCAAQLKHEAVTTTAGVGVDWLPFDFELSTQDCREIGV